MPASPRHQGGRRSEDPSAGRGNGSRNRRPRPPSRRAPPTARLHPAPIMPVWPWPRPLLERAELLRLRKARTSADRTTGDAFDRGAATSRGSHKKARLARRAFSRVRGEASVDLLFRLLVDRPGDRDRPEAIAVVDVVAELHHAFRRRPGGDVGPVDVDGLREPRVDALAALDRLVDLIAAPARRVPEQEGDVVAHVLHPYAARRDEAEIVAEDALRGRVVHVDAVRVRDVDAHEA